jgi:hypothetical protein
LDVAVLWKMLTGLCSITMDACRAEGMIKNFNTIEEFKKADRAGMMKRAANTVRLRKAARA